MRRMALRAHHAKPAERNPQRSLNAFPRARELPARTFRPEINGPAAKGGLARGGGAMTRPAPREVTPGPMGCAVDSRSLVFRN